MTPQEKSTIHKIKEQLAHTQGLLDALLEVPLEKETSDNILHEFFKRSEYNLSDFTWIGSPKKPEGEHVVLDITLATLEETFEFAWDWVKDTQERNWRWNGVKSDPEHLRLLEGSEPFKPFTLRWRVLDMDTNVGKAPKDVRDPKTAAGIAVLFYFAQNPEDLRETEYWYWMTGLECTAPDCGPWQGVPYVDFDRDDRQVELNAGWCDYCDDCLAVPVFREY